MRINTGVKKEIISVFDKHIKGGYMLILFGSFVNNSATGASDIDLAVYGAKKIPPSSFLELKEDLDEKVRTLREIDLVDLTERVTDKALLANIIKGKIWRKSKNYQELLKNLKKRSLSTRR